MREPRASGSPLLLLAALLCILAWGCAGSVAREPRGDAGAKYAIARAGSLRPATSRAPVADLPDLFGLPEPPCVLQYPETPAAPAPAGLLPGAPVSPREHFPEYPRGPPPAI